jgi:sec-independent protein translocase protein TatA
MFNISKELIIVLVIVLVIFGPSQLPKLAKMFGKTMKNVREGMDGVTGEDEDETPAKPKEMKAAAPEEVATKKDEAEDEVAAPVKKKTAADDAE